MTFGDTPAEISRETRYSFRVRTTITPATSGKHKLSLASIGPSTLYIDGQAVASVSGDFDEKDVLFFTYGSRETIVSFEMVQGRAYNVHIDYCSHDRQLDADVAPRMSPMEDKFQGIRLGFEEHSDADLPSEAAAVARDCDAAIVVVGRDKEWESEGFDIPSFELPGEQQRLIQQVAAVCKRTVVIVQAGTPVQMESWIDSVAAVLYTWYQGQELGNAAADVLTGRGNPSGRLPITFPRRIEASPAYSSFPGQLGRTEYAEGLYVGYKWWDLTGEDPLFPIGFGLSYSTFEISPDTISSHVISEKEPLRFSVRVHNTGGTGIPPGRQTVLVWMSPGNGAKRLERPLKQICAFAKSKPLTQGQEDLVELEADFRSFGMFDPLEGSWVIDADSEFDILVGSSAADARLAWRVAAPDKIMWQK